MRPGRHPNVGRELRAENAEDSRAMTRGDALTVACPRLRGEHIAPTSKRSPVVVSFDSIKKSKKGRWTAPHIDSFPGTVGNFRFTPQSIKLTWNHAKYIIYSL
jgi:hypothetical protein